MNASTTMLGSTTNSAIAITSSPQPGSPFSLGHAVPPPLQQQQQQQQQQQPPDVSVLGMVRSAKINAQSVKKRFPIYKKAFWVAKESTGQLEFYKNDQAPQAKGSISASQIKGVSFTGDKQNKFFDLCVQLRGGLERRFRFNSRQERERWYNIVSTMASRHSAQSQWHGVLTVIHRRLASASSGSPYRFEVDLQGIGDGPHEMLQYCVEAVDIGIDFARLVTKTFLTATGKEESNVGAVPFVSVKLALMMAQPCDLENVTGGDQEPSTEITGTPAIGSGGSVNGAAAANDAKNRNCVARGELQRLVNSGTRYDPSSKRLVLAIVLHPDPITGDMQFRLMQLKSVVMLLQSSVWRNPVFEGWLSQSPEAHEQLQRIESLIFASKQLPVAVSTASLSSTAATQHVSAGSGSFSVTLQYGHDMEGVDEAHLESYLHEHVGVSLLQTVYHAMSALMEEFPEVRASDGNDFTAPTATAAATARLTSARECFEKYVVGIGVRLDRDALDCNVMPSMELLHRMWGDKTMNTSSIVMSRYRRWAEQHEGGGGLLGGTLSGVGSSTQFSKRDIGEQLRELLLTVRLGFAFNEGGEILSRTIGTRDGCIVHWESFAQATRELGVDVDVRTLPALSLQFVDRYVLRLQQLQRGLRSISYHGGTFFEQVFLRCVSALTVDFVPFAMDSPQRNVYTTPTLRSGILIDPILLWSTGCNSDDVACETDFDAPPISWGLSLVFTYATQALGPWVMGYFSNTSNIVPAPDRHAVPDGDADDSSSSESEDLDQMLDFGDAVASERKIETQILDVQQVVNLVYDGQQGHDVQLKVGSGVIREAVDALQRMFSEGPISKHILLRILNANLQRLRELFVARNLAVASRSDDRHADEMRQNNSTPYAPLNRDAARAMLQHYCEYEQTELLIDNALDAVESIRRTNTRSLLPEAIVRSGSPMGSHAARTGANTAVAESHQPFPSMMEQQSTRAPPAGTVARSTSSSSYEEEAPAFSTTRQGTGIASLTSQHTSPYDYEALAAIALCALLPHEARLAMKCRRDILWFGLENTGKTMLINSMRGVAEPTHPTIGLTESVIAYKEWVFGCKELGGRADFRKNWKQYMARVNDGVHAAVYVVDACKPSSFAEAREYLEAVSGYSLLRSVPLLIIFNNYRRGDRRAPKPNALFDALGLDKLTKSRKVQYCLCDVSVVHSAHRSLPPDVHEGLSWLCEILRQGGSGDPPPMPK